MYDYGKKTIAISCAGCNKAHSITLNQIANEESNLCSCGELMIFQDEEQNTKNLVIEMNLKSHTNQNHDGVGEISVQ